MLKPLGKDGDLVWSSYDGHILILPREFAYSPSFADWWISSDSRMTTDDTPVVAPSGPYGEGPSGDAAAASEFVGEDTPLPTHYDAPSSSYGPAAPWQELYARFDAFLVQQTHWNTRVDTGLQTWQTQFRADVDERLDGMDAHMRDYFGRFPPPPPSGPQ